jgi:putative heme transporter
MTVRPDEHVPLSLRVAAAWSWRVLVVGVAVGAAVVAISRLQLLALAVFVGLLLTALLAPLHARLCAVGVPRWLATVLMIVGFIAVLLGAAVLVGGSIVNEWGELSVSFQEGLDDIRVWLADGPLHASQGQIDQWLATLQATLSDNQSSLVSGALTTATTAVEVVTGAFLALFASIFFLHDGRGISRWFVGLFPARSQEGVEHAGAAGWITLTGYVRGTVIIALVDATSIGIVLSLLRVPLAIPLAVLVFFGAFVPIVGALVTGFVAVVVALAANGLWTAIAVLAAIIAIQQVEGHLLQPVVMGRLVRLHPLAVVLAVTAGSVLAGIVGAVVAVPLVAVVNVVVRSYRERSVGDQDSSAVEGLDSDPREPDSGQAPATPESGASHAETGDGAGSG